MICLAASIWALHALNSYIAVTIYVCSIIYICMFGCELSFHRTLVEVGVCVVRSLVLKNVDDVVVLMVDVDEENLNFTGE